jgi:phage gp36-like protein
MAYATLDDLKLAFGELEIGQLTQRARDFAQGSDTAAAATFLDDASAEIDSRLAVRYTVPVSPAPKMLRAVCCDIARYRMFDDRASDTVRQRYTDGIKWLDALAAGKAVLLTDAGTAAAAATSDDTGTVVAEVAGSTLTPVYGSAFLTAYGTADVATGLGSTP